MSEKVSPELARLIIWAWNNTDKWPTEPFSFIFITGDASNNTDLASLKQVDNPAEFYREIGLACVTEDHIWRPTGILLGYLKALKLLVEEKN